MKDMTPRQFVTEYKKNGSIRAVSRTTGASYGLCRRRYVRAVADGLMDPIPIIGGKPNRDRKGPGKEPKMRPPVAEGSIRAMHTPGMGVPPKGEVRRHLFTCAQNNTKLHGAFWRNLHVLADHYGADIHVSRFTYVKAGLGARGDKAQLVRKDDTMGGGVDMWWSPDLKSYLSDERLEVAPGLVWCGEMNILPTAVNPLSGLEAYTGRKSSVFPHVKIAMQSVPSGKYEATKLVYTTGAVTIRNYIQRKAGLKADFHHCYGALLVEVDSDGDWFCRQVNADDRGTIYDLDVRVRQGELQEGDWVHAVTWGDVHVADLDPVVKETAWGDGGMLDILRPKEQHMHDVLDFRSRSHHEIKDPHVMFAKFKSGVEDVEKELLSAGSFFVVAKRDWCGTVVVDSNHHDHLGRWLREQDARKDPVNVQFWLAVQSRVYDVLNAGEELNYLREGLLAAGWVGIDDVVDRFLGQDESYVVCGSIECGMHGHHGTGGSRGNPRQFARMGRKANTGHTHQAGIVNGVYTTGTCSILHPSWVRGPGAWTHSHIVTYLNGKRTIVTMWNGKWRA